MPSGPDRSLSAAELAVRQGAARIVVGSSSSGSWSPRATCSDLRPEPALRLTVEQAARELDVPMSLIDRAYTVWPKRRPRDLAIVAEAHTALGRDEEHRPRVSPPSTRPQKRSYGESTEPPRGACSGQDDGEHLYRQDRRRSHHPSDIPALTAVRRSDGSKDPVSSASQLIVTAPLKHVSDPSPPSRLST
jgi:hypothetical protein